jgi:hypothetical protein
MDRQNCIHYFPNGHFADGGPDREDLISISGIDPEYGMLDPLADMYAYEVPIETAPFETELKAACTGSAEASHVEGHNQEPY